MKLLLAYAFVEADQGMLVVYATILSVCEAYGVFEGFVWVMLTHLKEVQVMLYHSLVAPIL